MINESKNDHSEICYGYIFARGGSKGLPRKNILPLGGKPLIAYSIEALRESRYISRIIVSTDDAEIAETARNFGAEVPFMRPAELASDGAPELLAWKHALHEAEREGKTPDIFVSAPTTSPLRLPSDIDSAVETLIKTGCDMVVSVTESARSPYFNMVTRDAEGRTKIFARLPGEVTRRQDAPPVYDMTTVVYAAKSSYVMAGDTAMPGDVRSIVVPRERAADIDTKLDFEFAEFLLNRR
ncbi:acylneuraminate cytidylyltransferase [Synergistales bacterium]|nr:acylneuraminate cytidylyltransferase [Synergistales bacterium]